MLDDLDRRRAAFRLGVRDTLDAAFGLDGLDGFGAMRPPVAFAPAARRHRVRVVVVIARRHRARVVVVIELLIHLGITKK